jgi:hypothetical protein
METAIQKILSENIDLNEHGELLLLMLQRSTMIIVMFFLRVFMAAQVLDGCRSARL